MVQIGAARGYCLLRWALAVLAYRVWSWKASTAKHLVPAAAGCRLYRCSAYPSETSGFMGPSHSGGAGPGWTSDAYAGMVCRCAFIRPKSKFSPLAQQMGEWPPVECRESLSLSDYQNVHPNGSILYRCTLGCTGHAAVLVDGRQLFRDWCIPVLPDALPVCNWVHCVAVIVNRSGL